MQFFTRLAWHPCIQHQAPADPGVNVDEEILRQGKVTDIMTCGAKQAGQPIPG